MQRFNRLDKLGVVGLPALGVHGGIPLYLLQSFNNITNPVKGDGYQYRAFGEYLLGGHTVGHIGDDIIHFAADIGISG